MAVMMMNRKTGMMDKCIGSLPIQTRDILHKIRSIARRVVPNSIETVSYGMPTLKLNGKNFFHFCGFKTYIGIYPAIDEVDTAIPGLKIYRTGKGTFQFPLDQSIPYDLIKQMILYRAKMSDALK